jgi:nitroimidazol reductase NimA-like FMN-containing flavoprotein (pyridoxamine 5'-phosphate oxidase superfamily)
MTTRPLRTTFADPRTGLEPMGRGECLMLLAQHQHQDGVGRLAVVEDDFPLIVPVNFAMIEDRIVFRSGAGTKLEAALRHAKVAFEIDHVNHEARTGWSVLVRGMAEVVTSTHQLFALEHVALQPFGKADKAHWVMIHPESITGRRVPTFASLLWVGDNDLSLGGEGAPAAPHG